mmetsp:Transcript_49367/g.91905  ORF Transcript_49367/g.91905 Transcript_49367/m.91905 type:complete len:259 (+) Transcript_49367:266-1042(+)
MYSLSLNKAYSTPHSKVESRASERHTRRVSTHMGTLPSRARRALQNINISGVKLFFRTYLGEPFLAVPHIQVRDISEVNWRALRDAGFQGCVFDKDNTLTLPYALEVHDPLRASLDDCRDVFEGRLAILSNSAGLKQYDPQGSLAAALERALRIPVLLHGSKKPAGTRAELEDHFGVPAHKLIMIGDRYFTDVVYGNLHGMLTIRPAPFTDDGETFVVKKVRQLEDSTINRWRRTGIRAAEHPLVPSAFSAFVKSSAI